MHRSLFTRSAGALGVLTALALAFAPTASAAEDAPAGNNGTIKVDDVLMDDGNESVPHPGCTFVVDFFGYDVGTRTATLVFDGQAPTGGGELTTDTFTFDVATRTGGNQLDASRSFDLSDALVGITPQAQQGWHVMLTVHVDGAQGSDVKHKVFWVSDCSSPPLVAAQQAVDAAAAAATLAADTTAWTTAEQSFLASQAAAAQAASVQAAAAARSAADAGSLPRTGAHSALIAEIALALIAAGALLLVPNRRLTARRPTS